MAAAASFIAVPKSPVVAFLNGDGVAFKSVMSGATLGSRVDSLSITNSDPTNAYVVQLAVLVSGVDYVLGEAPVPAGAGTNGVAPAVAGFDPDWIPALNYTEGGAVFLGNGATLRARVKAPVAGGNAVHIVGVAGDY